MRDGSRLSLGAAALVLVALSVIPSKPARAQEASTLGPAERAYGLSSFWSEAKYNLAFFDQVPELDWDATYLSFLGESQGVQRDLDYFRLLQRFGALLQEGHTNVTLPRDLWPRYGATPPLAVDAIEGMAVVVNAAKFLEEQVPIGSRIVAVDGVETLRHLETRVFPFLSTSTPHHRLAKGIRGSGEQCLGLLVGPLEESVARRLVTPAGSEYDVTVDRQPRAAPVDWVRPARRERPLLSVRWVEPEIALVALNSFNDAQIVADFERLVPELEGASGILLDVRDNGGGNSSHGWNIGRHFTSEAVATSKWRTRSHVAVYKAWGSRSSNELYRSHYRGEAWEDGGGNEFPRLNDPTLLVPTVVLFGSHTYSAAEDFLVFMRANPRVVFVGGTSAGSTGQPLVFELPGGAYAGITSKRDTFPDGTEFVGFGVKPDLEVHQTLAAFHAGRDLVVEKAVEILWERIDAED